MKMHGRSDEPWNNLLVNEQNGTKTLILQCNSVELGIVHPRLLSKTLFSYLFHQLAEAEVEINARTGFLKIIKIEIKSSNNNTNGCFMNLLRTLCAPVKLPDTSKQLYFQFSTEKGRVCVRERGKRGVGVRQVRACTKALRKGSELSWKSTRTIWIK